MPGQNTSFDGLIAPCGMNCGICIAYHRERRPCSGCREHYSANGLMSSASGLGSAYKPKHCANCSIFNCELLSGKEPTFCYSCEKFPCRRLKQLDKRYRERYGMSMLENLESIRDSGLDHFIEGEREKWRCNQCGAVLSAHRDECLQCGEPYRGQNKIGTSSIT